MDKKSNIYNFLKSQTHAVMSTTNNDGNPEAALVGFGEDNELTLVIGTDVTTRKYKNIQSKPNVAIVVGLGDEKITVQYEGTASTLNEVDKAKYTQLYFAKTPSAKKYEKSPNQVYLKISPTWIRYTDYNKDPIEVFEINFDGIIS